MAEMSENSSARRLLLAELVEGLRKVLSPEKRCDPQIRNGILAIADWLSACPNDVRRHVFQARMTRGLDDRFKELFVAEIERDFGDSWRGFGNEVAANAPTVHKMLDRVMELVDSEECEAECLSHTASALIHVIMTWHMLPDVRQRRMTVDPDADVRSMRKPRYGAPICSLCFKPSELYKEIHTTQFEITFKDSTEDESKENRKDGLKRFEVLSTSIVNAVLPGELSELDCSGHTLRGSKRSRNKGARTGVNAQKIEEMKALQDSLARSFHQLGFCPPAHFRSSRKLIWYLCFPTLYRREFEDELRGWDDKQKDRERLLNELLRPALELLSEAPHFCSCMHEVTVHENCAVTIIYGCGHSEHLQSPPPKKVETERQKPARYGAIWELIRPILEVRDRFSEAEFVDLGMVVSATRVIGRIPDRITFHFDTAHIYRMVAKRYSEKKRGLR